MKKIIALFAAALTVFSAAAQNQKLNFEAPLFGVTRKNVNPKWSVVAFGEVSGGYSHRLNTPAQIRPSGYFGELNILELRYRPWRDGNVFTWGITRSLDVQPVVKGTVFSEDGKFIPTPENWLSAYSMTGEPVTFLQIGYTREFGDWKAAIFVSPGIGHGTSQNQYKGGIPFYEDGLFYGSPEDGRKIAGYFPGASHMANYYDYYGFRLGVKAGIWYRCIGLKVGWHLGSVAPGNQNVLSVGLSVRY